MIVLSLCCVSRLLLLCVIMCIILIVWFRFLFYHDSISSDCLARVIYDIYVSVLFPHVCCLHVLSCLCMSVVCLIALISNYILHTFLKVYVCYKEVSLCVVEVVVSFGL